MFLPNNVRIYVITRAYHLDLLRVIFHASPSWCRTCGHSTHERTKIVLLKDLENLVSEGHQRLFRMVWRVCHIQQLRRAAVENICAGMEHALGFKVTSAVELLKRVPSASTAHRFSCGSRHDCESYIGPVRYDLGRNPKALSSGTRLWLRLRLDTVWPRVRRDALGCPVNPRVAQQRSDCQVQKRKLLGKSRSENGQTRVASHKMPAVTGITFCCQALVGKKTRGRPISSSWRPSIMTPTEDESTLD